MSFFEDVFSDVAEGESVEALSAAEAFAAIALALSAADGTVDDVEIENIVTYLRRMHLFRDFDTPQFVALFDKLVRLLVSGGPEQLIEAARDSIPDDLRPTAFALSVDVALADGVIEERERALMATLRTSLGISDELALKITEVMVIKNRG